MSARLSGTRQLEKLVTVLFTGPDGAEPSAQSVREPNRKVTRNGVVANDPPLHDVRHASPLCKWGLSSWAQDDAYCQHKDSGDGMKKRMHK